MGAKIDYYTTEEKLSFDKIANPLHRMLKNVEDLSGGKVDHPIPLETKLQSQHENNSCPLSKVPLVP